MYLSIYIYIIHYIIYKKQPHVCHQHWNQPTLVFVNQNWKRRHLDEWLSKRCGQDFADTFPIMECSLDILNVYISPNLQDYIMFYHVLSCFIMFYHVLSCFIMFYPNSSMFKFQCSVVGASLPFFSSGFNAS